MNNDQFRRLLFDSSSSKNALAETQIPVKSTPTQTLGSRTRSSIPMAPRTISRRDATRQLAEDHLKVSAAQQPPHKKFRSASMPKGTRLPTGYHDRAQQRQSGEGIDDNRSSETRSIEEQVRVLEEMVKLGQIDNETFQKLQTELGVGGSMESTHMVKGLDWELLRKVKAGEDVSAQAKMENETAAEQLQRGSVDEEFERVLEEKGQEVLTREGKVRQEKGKKRGNMAPTSQPVRSRDEILRQLKESRRGSAGVTGDSQLPDTTLGMKFKKIGDTRVQRQRFVEQDKNGRRREVILITDAGGSTKRKVKWLDEPDKANKTADAPPGLLAPDKDARPLGMDVSGLAKHDVSPSEEKDDDIFEGIGADYNPLVDIVDEPSSESGEENKASNRPTPQFGETLVSESAVEQSRPRNYFGSSASGVVGAEQIGSSSPLTRDPAVIAALKRAATLRHDSTSSQVEENHTDQEISLRRKNFLEEMRRQEAQDTMDLDLGFGSSRIGDDEDDDDEMTVRSGNRPNKRKRGPKKRRGDKDSASDVIRVLEGRKK